MKKSKLFVVALIATLMTAGLVLASCRPGCDGKGNCSVWNDKGTLCTDFGCDVYKHDGDRGTCDC